MKNKNILIRIASLLLVAILATSAVSCGSIKLDEPTISGESGYEKLEFIDKLFSTYSVFDLDEEALMDAILKGYVAGTGDKYAEYFTAEEYEQLTADNKGELVGVGISVIQNADNGCIEIVNVMPDSPALEAELLSGDLITYVGIGDKRQSVAEIGYTLALDLLRGEEGSVSEFTVSREIDGEMTEIEFSIVRKKIITPSVISHICQTDNSVGIVKIIQFNLTTPKQFSTAMDSLMASGCDKFVFDVRYNPGGDLKSIKGVISYFLNEGDTYIRVVDKNGNITSDVIAAVKYTNDYVDCSVDKSDIGKYRDLKYAVLTNGSTASAAELFTSTLMDYKLSVTVGTKTYGKGTVQSTFKLAPYGYSGALKLTTKYYYPPLSDSYDGIGIAPDLEVELDEALASKNIYTITDAQDNQIQAAIEELYKK